MNRNQVAASFSSLHLAFVLDEEAVWQIPCCHLMIRVGVLGEFQYVAIAAAWLDFLVLLN
jgi:hypothetical protein